MPSTVTLSPSHAGTNTRTGYGIADSSIVRDASLSITARLVWVLLDRHQGARESLRIKRVTLLAELDVDGARLERDLATYIGDRVREGPSTTGLVDQFERLLDRIMLLRRRTSPAPSVALAGGSVPPYQRRRSSTAPSTWAMRSW